MQNHSKTNIIIVLVLIIGLAIGFSFGKSNSSVVYNKNIPMGMHMMPDGSMMTNTDSSMSMQDMMTAMNAGLSGKFGDEFDVAFLSEMIVHHEGAVAMARLALSNAKHEELKDLARAIISAQNEEIAQMKQWERQWYNR